MQHALARSTAIRLAAEAPFALGQLWVDPPRRSVTGQGAAPVTVEPRIMQVLVALAHAGGEVVGRDELIERAWDGVVVGDAAINRAIARLRHLGGELGGAFAIETVTKVGYRLLVAGRGADATPRPDAVFPPQRLLPEAGAGVAAPMPVAAPGAVAAQRVDAGQPPATADAKRSQSPLSRRVLLAGGLAVAAGAGGLAWWTGTADERRARAQAEELLARARMLQQLNTHTTFAHAMELLEEAVRTDPNYARAWGQLALARASESAMDPPGEALLRSRIADAANRALRLDPGNADAAAALVLMPATRIDWLGREAQLVAAVQRSPRHFQLRERLADHLWNSGRVSDAARELARALAIEPGWPGAQTRYFTLLWASGRLAEADAAARSVFEAWHTRESTWLTYFHYLALSGRPRAALVLEEGDTPFPGGPVPLRDLSLLSARALASGRKVERDEAIAAHWSARRNGAYPSTMAAAYLVQLGAPADALTFLERMLAGPRLNDGQRPTAGAMMRMSLSLFLPPMRPLWGEPRFGALLEAVGLEAYWRAAGITPDFRRASLAAR